MAGGSRVNGPVWSLFLMVALGSYNLPLSSSLVFFH